MDPLKTVEVTVETGEVLATVQRLWLDKYVIKVNDKVDFRHIGTNQD